MTIRILEYAHAVEIMTTRIDRKANHQLGVEIMTIQINGKGSRQLGQRGAADGKSYRRSTQTTRIDGKRSHQLGRRGAANGKSNQRLGGHRTARRH